MQPETDYDDENYDSFFSYAEVIAAARDICAAIGISALLVAAWFKWG